MQAPMNVNMADADSNHSHISFQDLPDSDVWLRSSWGTGRNEEPASAEAIRDQPVPDPLSDHVSTPMPLAIDYLTEQLESLRIMRFL